MWALVGKIKLQLLAPMTFMPIGGCILALCTGPIIFQCCMMSIFSDLIEDIMEVFMDNFYVYGSSFDNCLVNLEKLLERYEEKTV